MSFEASFPANDRPSETGLHEVRDGAPRAFETASVSSTPEPLSVTDRSALTARPESSAEISRALTPEDVAVFVESNPAYTVQEPDTYTTQRGDVIDDVPRYHFIGTPSETQIKPQDYEYHMDKLRSCRYPDEVDKTPEEENMILRIVDAQAKFCADELNVFVNDRLADPFMIHMFDDPEKFLKARNGEPDPAHHTVRAVNTDSGILVLREPNAQWRDIFNRSNISHELVHDIQAKTVLYLPHPTNPEWPLHIAVGYADPVPEGAPTSWVGLNEIATEMTSHRIAMAAQADIPEMDRRVAYGYSGLGALMSGIIIATADRHGVEPASIEREMSRDTLLRRTVAKDMITSTLGPEGSKMIEHLDGRESLGQYLDIAQQLKLPPDAETNIQKIIDGKPFTLYPWRGWGETGES